MKLFGSSKNNKGQESTSAFEFTTELDLIRSLAENGIPHHNQNNANYDQVKEAKAKLLRAEARLKNAKASKIYRTMEKERQSSTSHSERTGNWSGDEALDNYYIGE